jgi:hypothetical protein
MTEQPLRACLRVRPQPVAHVHRQPDPAVRPGGSGSPVIATRSRANSNRPAFSPSCKAPRPRVNSAASDSRQVTDLLGLNPLTLP